MFSRVVGTTFKEFIHKFLEVYFDDWKIFGMVKKHVSSLLLILDIYRKYEISLNLKKWFFCLTYGILLGHVFCKEGMMVDPPKIIVFINWDPQNNVKKLCATLGDTTYYHKFNMAYVQITTQMEKLLKKDDIFS